MMDVVDFVTSGQVVTAAIWTGLAIFIVCMFTGMGWSLFTDARRRARREQSILRITEMKEKSRMHAMAMAEHVAKTSDLTGEALESRVDELLQKYINKYMGGEIGADDNAEAGRSSAHR